MGRLRASTTERAEVFADRGLVLARELERKRVWARIIDQIVGCFTSVGANVFEADEAMSRKDFCKALAVSVKELNESRYWIRRVVSNGWIKPQRLAPRESEALELKRMLGAMVVRTARTTAKNGQRRTPVRM